MIIQLVGFLGIIFLIWWLLARRGNVDRAFADQRAWFYLTWSEEQLVKHHEQYVDLMARSEKRGMCIQQIDAIKAALEMRQKLKAESQCDGQQ